MGRWGRTGLAGLAQGGGRILRDQGSVAWALKCAMGGFKAQNMNQKVAYPSVEWSYFAMKNIAVLSPRIVRVSEPNRCSAAVPIASP